MDEISYGPKRDFRLPSHPWFIAAVTAAACALAAALVLTGTGRRSGDTGRPAAVPGTLLVSCAMANWTRLNPDWRSSSLRVGSLWFVDNNQSGYVRDSNSPIAAGAAAWSTVAGSVETSKDAVIPLEVAAGSTVVIKPASGTRSYFRFLTGSGAGAASPLPAPLPPGDTGYTFVACPRQHAGPNGRVTDFLLGFSIDPGRTAPVEIWTSASARPVRITFVAPAVPLYPAPAR